MCNLLEHAYATNIYKYLPRAQQVDRWAHSGLGSPLEPLLLGKQIWTSSYRDTFLLYPANFNYTRQKPARVSLHINNLHNKQCISKCASATKAEQLHS